MRMSHCEIPLKNLVPEIAPKIVADLESSDIEFFRQYATNVEVVLNFGDVMALANIKKVFPKAQSLSLVNSILASCPKTSLNGYNDSLVSLHELRIEALDIQEQGLSVANFLTTEGAFITKLDLMKVKIQDDIVRALPQNLKQLTLEQCNLQFNSASCEERGTLMNLTQFRACETYSEGTVEILFVAKMIPESLRSLELSFPSGSQHSYDEALRLISDRCELVELKLKRVSAQIVDLLIDSWTCVEKLDISSMFFSQQHAFISHCIARLPKLKECSFDVFPSGTCYHSVTGKSRSHTEVVHQLKDHPDLTRIAALSEMPDVEVSRQASLFNTVFASVSPFNMKLCSSRIWSVFFITVSYGIRQ